MLFCKDIWFNEHAHQYGPDGADLMVAPGAPFVSHRFAAPLHAAAVVAGCYGASSNRSGPDHAGEPFERRYRPI